MLEGTNKSLHIEFGIHLVLANIDEANFNGKAELCGFFFRLRDARLIAIGELYGNWLSGTALWRAP